MYEKKRKQFYISQLLSKSAVYLYVVIMVSIFPLFFMDGSIKLTAAKITIFNILNIALYSMLLICGIAWLVERVKGNHICKLKIQLNSTDIFAIILIFALFLSTLMSLDKENALWGIGGGAFGSCAFLLCVLNYFAISRFFSLNQIVIWFYLIGSGLVFALQIANNWGWNILNVWQSDERFAATLGNINVNAGFDVIMISIGMGLFMMSHEKRSIRIYGSYLFIGFAGLLCCRSDLGIAGIAAAFLALAWFKLKQNEYFTKYMMIIVIFGMAAGCVAIGRYAGAKYMFSFSSSIAFLTTPYISALIIIVGIILIALFQQKEKNGTETIGFIKNIHKIVFSVVIFVICGAAVLFILINTIYKNADIPVGLEFLRFTDSFASNRGYIWGRTLLVYVKDPWERKLYGYGVNNFPDFINPLYYEEMLSKDQGVFIDAHNEFLQMLATTGIIGVIGYFGMIISLLVKFIKKVDCNKAAIIPVIVIFGQVAQGMFCNPNIFVTPLLFVFLGIAEAERRNNNNNR